MRKPITPYAHGVLDYTTTAMVASAPRLMRFPKAAEYACYVLAGTLTGMALLTDYPLGAKRVIPFKAHGASDVSLGVLLPLVPWMLGFGRNARARNFFLGLAAFSGVVSAMTDWDKDTERSARRRHKRRPRIAA